MNTNVDPRRTTSNQSKQDLRTWLSEMEAAGEVTHISGADRETEIGGIVDIYQRKIGNPLALFDDIPGYPKGHRVLANLLTSVKRINMTVGNSPDSSEMELVQFWRRYMREAKTIPPVEVQSGALTENVLTGDDIDLFRIPVPKWHEHDGGYYIGTGDMVIMRDPGHRLGQLRRLSRAGPRQEHRDRDVLQGQARRHDPAQVSRPRQALPRCRRLRHASGAVHDRRPRNSARQERIRRRRRTDRRASRGDHGPQDRPADPRPCRDRLRGLYLS